MNLDDYKVYTSAEMREAADTFWVGGVICEVKNAEGRVLRHIKSDEIIAMLRQAAVEKIELEQYRVAAEADDELRPFIERIKRIVEECEKQMPNCRLEEGKCNPNDGGYCEHCEELKVRDALMAVLKVAKGEES